MVDFFHKLELSDNKYQINGTVRYGNYEGKFLFTMKDFVLFRTYRQSMYFMSNRLLKYNIDGLRVPQFQLGYISDTKIPYIKFV